MSEATFTFRVDEALKDQFTTAAKDRDHTGAQLLRDFMRDSSRKPPNMTPGSVARCKSGWTRPTPAAWCRPNKSKRNLQLGIRMVYQPHQ